MTLSNTAQPGPACPSPSAAACQGIRERERREKTHRGAPSGANKDTAWQVLSDGRWLETRVITSHTGGPGPVMRAERRAMRRGSLTDRIRDVTESYKMTARVNNLIFSSLQLAGSITET